MEKKTLEKLIQDHYHSFFQHKIFFENFKQTQMADRILHENQSIYKQKCFSNSCIIKTQMSQQQASKNQNLTHTKKLGNIEFASYLKSMPQTVQLIFSIQKSLENIDPFYYNSILIKLKGRQFQQIESCLKRQLDEIVNKKSFYHKICNAIQSRRKCIQKIKRDISKSEEILNFFKKQYPGSTKMDEVYNEYVENYNYSAVHVDDSIQSSIKLLSSIFIDMYRLRDMSLYLVETIHRWRVELEEHSDRCGRHTSIKFLFQGRDFYNEVVSDTKFIWESKLNQFMWFDTHQDPFFVRNVIILQQRQQRTILQRYFTEIIYPKKEQTVSQCIRCYEMLFFKYEVKLFNLFEEQQMLIENYLKMQKDHLEFNQTSRPEKNEEYQLNQDEESPTKMKKPKINRRGWVFDRSPKRNNRQNLNKIIDSHKQKMQYPNIIKSYNISNYPEKTSIALAYLSDIQEKERKDNFRYKTSKPIREREKNFFSEGQEKPKNQIQNSRISLTSKKNPYRSRQRKRETEEKSTQKLKTDQSKLFHSLTKFNPIIYEDPKEHLPETPKNNKSNIREHSKNFIKINTFSPSLDNLKRQEEIQIEQEQTPINFKQFFQVFRADTSVKKFNPNLTKSRKDQGAKLVKLKQYIDNKRLERAKSLPYVKKKPLISLPKKKNIKNKSKSKSRISNKSNSYAEYTQIQKPSEFRSNENENAMKVTQKTQYLSLKPKTIPLDMISPYLRHIFSQQHSSSKSFSLFNQKDIQEKLENPYIHCLIFDIITSKHELIGQVILSESLGNRKGKLKYTVEFLNVHLFQLLITALLRIAEQLLSATPCKEVVIPLLVDQLDPVSIHFINLIDNTLIEKSTKFSKLTILEKAIPSYKNSDRRQHLCIFTPLEVYENRNLSLDLGLKMMGNYRSLKLQAKCMVMTSNFRLRSSQSFKNITKIYNKCSLGYLYSKIFGTIMTNYHIKTIRQASYSNGSTQINNLVKNDIFFRNIVQKITSQQTPQQQQLIRLTPFNTMTDLINYLTYKDFTRNINFTFLQQSRFILNHELLLAEIDIDLSLEFLLVSTPELYIFQNHHNFNIEVLVGNKNGEKGYILPTTVQKLGLFIMSAQQYQKCMHSVDLYSYLSFHTKNSLLKNLPNLPQVILPNLSTFSQKMSKLSAFDKFFPLFPERQFYSASFLSIINYWNSYYPSAVVHGCHESAIVIEQPFILGFYDRNGNQILTAFLVDDQK